MDTRSEKTDGAAKPQTERKHPDEWQGDLNPDRMAGQNIGERSAEAEQGWRTAYDVKEVHRRLNEIPDDDLKNVPIVKPGTRLQQGAKYIDLKREQPREFTATGEMEAGDRDVYVAKDRVPYPLWNRLTGVDDPERR